MPESSRYIRLRGLPWSVTPAEIIDFLHDIKIVDGEDGIYLCVNKWNGRSNGEAFVHLETEEDEEEALKRNKETLGSRYIEIFPASNLEAEQAMKKPGPSDVLRLRGLPFSVTKADIEKFFQGLDVKLDREGIHIKTDRRGRATGEAFVQFQSPEDTEQALKLNREMIGHRYVEIFRSSESEMEKNIHSKRSGPPDRRRDDRRSRGFQRFDNRRNDRSRSRDNNIWARNSNDGFGRNSGGSSGRGVFGGGMGNSGRFNGGNNFNDFNNFGNNRNSFNNNDGYRGNSNNIFGGNFVSGGNRFGSGGMKKEDNMYCVHMRGLPYYCFENDVNKFFQPLRPSAVKIIYNSKGLHSGSADAYFFSHDDAKLAMEKHREQMGNRYIELFFDGKGKHDFRRI